MNPAAAYSRMGATGHVVAAVVLGVLVVSLVVWACRDRGAR